MRYVACGKKYAATIFVVAFFLCACSRLTASIPKDKLDAEKQRQVAEAQVLLTSLRNQNSSLKNFKGIGNIKVWRNGKIQIDQRVAWVGSDPARLSIVVFVSGYPAFRLASDGEWFYYYDPQGDQASFKKIRATDASLKQIISIHIDSSDMITMLAGRVPLNEYDAARLIRDEAASGYIILLKKRWGIFEKIYLDADKSRVQKLERFDRSGALVYRAIFEKMQTIQGYLVPARLTLSNDAGAEFQLDVARYWADVAVEPSMFVITPPK